LPIVLTAGNEKFVNALYGLLTINEFITCLTIQREIMITIIREPEDF